MSAVTDTTVISQVSSAPSAETSGGQYEPQPTLELPKPSIQATRFLDNLNEDDFKHVLFDDSLVTVSDTGKELGEFYVSVAVTKHQGCDCYLIHANSHGSIDSVPCGTSITAYVSNKLETLEQHHHEYVKLENHPLDRKTFIVKQPDGYVVNRVVAQGEDTQRMSHTFNTDDMQGFISEGSNLLLQRLLIKKGLPADFQLIAFDSDTHLCPMIYKPLDGRVQVVEKTELDVSGIERTINSLTDLPTSWQCYFTKDGHLTSRVQVGSPVTMRLLVVPAPVEDEGDKGEKPVFEKKPLNWEEDVQLYSKFVERKEQLKEGHASYMRQHPELRALTADFLQFLLLRKPADVIEFAADYFSSFSTKMPSSTPYAQSAVPSPYPSSTSNPKIQYLAKKPTL